MNKRATGDLVPQPLAGLLSVMMGIFILLILLLYGGMAFAYK